MIASLFGVRQRASLFGVPIDSQIFRVPPIFVCRFQNRKSILFMTVIEDQLHVVQPQNNISFKLAEPADDDEGNEVQAQANVPATGTSKLQV